MRAVGQGIWGGHTPSTVQLQSDVKLPQTQWCLVTCCEQTLVAVGERFLQQPPSIGRLHVIPTVSGGQFQPADNRIGSIYLERVGIGLAIEVCDVNERDIGVIVHDSLVAEAGVVVFQIDFERLAANRNLQRTAHAIVPRAFLAQFVYNESATARQQIVVLGQGMHRTVAFACRQTQAHHLVRGDLEVETGREKSAVEAAVVCPQPCHGHQFVGERIGILGIDARCRLALIGVIETAIEQVLFQVIVGQRKTSRQIMPLAEIGLEKQLGIGVFLVDMIVLMAPSGIHAVR